MDKFYVRANWGIRKGARRGSKKIWVMGAEMRSRGGEQRLYIMRCYDLLTVFDPAWFIHRYAEYVEYAE